MELRGLPIYGEIGLYHYHPSCNLCKVNLYTAHNADWFHAYFGEYGAHRNMTRHSIAMEEYRCEALEQQAEDPDAGPEARAHYLASRTQLDIYKESYKILQAHVETIIADMKRMGIWDPVVSGLLLWS